jgi:hypothetical protein
MFILNLLLLEKRIKISRDPPHSLTLSLSKYPLPFSTSISSSFYQSLVRGNKKHFFSLLSALFIFLSLTTLQTADYEAPSIDDN